MKYPEKAILSTLRVILLLAISVGGLRAQSDSKCVLAGADTVAAGSSASYTLSSCAAQSWKTTCGQVTGQSTGSVTINFSSSSCGSATITATSGAGVLATKNINIVQTPALASTAIDNAAQQVNYNRMPHLLTAPPASGGTCGGTYSYQWMSSTDNVNFLSITGATGQNYQPGPLTATTYFKRQTACSGSTVFTANTAEVKVYPSITGAILTPASQSINANATPSSISLIATASINPNLTYAWQNATNSSFSDAAMIAGANANSYTPGSLSATTFYRLAMVGGGDTIYSAPALVNIFSPLNGGIVSPASQSTNNLGVAGLLSCEGVSGGSGVYTYQWYSSTDNNNWILLNYINVPDYYPGAVQTKTWFRVLVSSNGLTATSASAVVNP